jgi:hypothetical protein
MDSDTFLRFNHQTEILFFPEFRNVKDCRSPSRKIVEFDCWLIAKIVIGLGFRRMQKIMISYFVLYYC